MKATKAISMLRAALLAGSVAALAGCGAPAPTGVAPGTPGAPGAGHPQGLLGDSLAQGAALLACSPLPYDSVTQTIGPAGGTIALAADTLVIPPGALDTAVTITAVAPSDTVDVVRFQPQGLVFQQPASLTMSYANCGLLGSSLPKQIAYTTDALAILEYVPSVDALTAGTVTGSLRHFSDYAVAW